MRLNLDNDDAQMTNLAKVTGSVSLEKNCNDVSADLWINLTDGLLDFAF